MGALVSTSIFHTGAEAIEVEENSFFNMVAAPIDQKGVVRNLARCARHKKAILIVNVASK